MGLYKPAETPAKEYYMNWVAGKFLEGACQPQFITNNAFRNWGHQFLYDEEVLKLARGKPVLMASRAVGTASLAMPS